VGQCHFLTHNENTMATSLFLFLFPMFTSGLYAGVVLAIFYTMQKRGRTYPWIYFAMGTAGYGVLWSLSWGWLQHLEAIMMVLCCIGMIFAGSIQGIKDRKALKEQQARRTQLKGIVDQLDLVQTRWLADELTNDEYDALMNDIQQRYYNERRMQEMAHTPFIL
jgi:uncharacterized membrane protein